MLLNPVLLVTISYNVFLCAFFVIRKDGYRILDEDLGAYSKVSCTVDKVKGRNFNEVFYADSQRILFNNTFLLSLSQLIYHTSLTNIFIKRRLVNL